MEKRTAEVPHLAYYDSLTDLPNRTLLAIDLQQTLATAAHMINWPHWSWFRSSVRKINDTLGHATGDLLLQQVAGRRRSDQKGDTIARFGGDEFAFSSPRFSSAQ